MSVCISSHCTLPKAVEKSDYICKPNTTLKYARSKKSKGKKKKTRLKIHINIRYLRRRKEIQTKCSLKTWYEQLQLYKLHHSTSIFISLLQGLFLINVITYLDLTVH